MARARASPASRPRPAAASRRPTTPCVSIREVTVSGPTHVMRAGQTRTALVSRTSASAISAPRTICPAGPPSAAAGAP